MHEPHSILSIGAVLWSVSSFFIEFQRFLQACLSRKNGAHTRSPRLASLPCPVSPHVPSESMRRVQCARAIDHSPYAPLTRFDVADGRATVNSEANSAHILPSPNSKLDLACASSCLSPPSALPSSSCLPPPLSASAAVAVAVWRAATPVVRTSNRRPSSQRRRPAHPRPSEPIQSHSPRMRVYHIRQSTSRME
jgi:hypothetical protein